MASGYVCGIMRDKCTAPAFIYPRTLILKHIDVPDPELQRGPGRAIIKEEKALGLSIGTPGNLKYTGKK